MRYLYLLSCVLLAIGCASDDLPDPPASDENNADENNASDVNNVVDDDTGATNNAGVDASKNDGPDVDADPDSGEVDSRLEDVLAELETDFDATVANISSADGWPLALDEGHLFVTGDPSFTHVAGDHDDWNGTSLQSANGFSWALIDVGAGNRYKFTDLGDRWEADPWSRAYEFDEFGVMSMTPPTEAHLERFFGLGAEGLQERTIRVWVPAEPVTHLVYVHDGQNLFNPGAINGGWRLQDAAQPGMMLVGVDNTSARIEEYTHVSDDLGSGPIGGRGDAYAAFVQGVVRPLIEMHHGEPEEVAVMGSSLGGLISLHIADQYPDDYDFVISLSGTLGWGSLGANNETIIERYRSAGYRQGLALYVYSGGNSDGCVDSDGDGIQDDGTGEFDNYCENLQFFADMQDAGYTVDQNLWHYWQPNAPHSETAWADHVSRPLQIFASF